MNIGLFVLLIFVLLLSSYAIFRQYSYQRLLQKEKDPQVNQKIKAFRIFLHEKQILTLLIVNVLLVFSLVLCIFSIYTVESRSSQLQKVTQIYDQMQNQQNERIQELQKKVGLTSKTPTSEHSNTDVKTSTSSSEKKSGSTSQSILQSTTTEVKK